MGKLRGQFIALLLTVITLFFGVVMVDLYFFNRMTNLYRLETKVAMVFLNWTHLVGQSSGYILSNETVGQAYVKWKREYDTYTVTWKRDVDELEMLAGVDDVLANKITWVRETIALGVRQMDLMDEYLGDFISDLRLHQPEIIDRYTMASLSDNQNRSSTLSIKDEFYLNKVRHSSSLLGDMMAPAIVTAQTRFQNQIADRIQVVNDQFSRIRLIFIGLILGVLIAFLIRILKLNFDLMAMVNQRTTELVDAKERAETANRAKSTFLANMSHELRTPLNAVLGFSQVMKNAADVTTEQRENLEIITRSGEHLLNLINNVLDISKIESGRVELEASPIDLHQLIQELKSLMALRAHGKGLDFTLEQSPDLPRHISVDGGKLRQVLINLIANAIQYTTSGGVILRAMTAPKEPSGQVGVRFEIEDTGPGIRKEERQRIFSPFVQLGDRAPTESGTGLGLAISKQYVELMESKIGVAGEPGKGSLFHFEIPVKVLPPEALPAESRRGRITGLADGQPRHRLLIAEDQPDSRLLLRKLLEPLDFELREAANGREAVELFEKWHPHLIWMDIRMPVMDGLEATKRIRAYELTAHGSELIAEETIENRDQSTKPSAISHQPSAPSEHVPIVAVTAHAFIEERGEILAAGCDDFIRKPYRDVEIIAALTKHLGVRFVYEEGPPPVDGAPPLKAADLADLPAELLNKLEQALVRLDIGAVSRAVEAIRAHHPSPSDALGAMARDLQYGRILRMIRAAGVTRPEHEV